MSTEADPCSFGDGSPDAYCDCCANADCCPNCLTDGEPCPHSAANPHGEPDPDAELAAIRATFARLALSLRAEPDAEP